MAIPSRKDIREAYKRGGGAAVWKLVKGHGSEGWKRATKWARDMARDARVALRHRKKKRLAVSEEIHDLRDEVLDLQAKREEVDALIAEEEAKPLPDQSKLDRLYAKRSDLHDKIAALNQKARSKESRKKQIIANAHHSIERRKWAAKAATVYRRKLKAARKRENRNEDGTPKFQPFMLNGHSANVTPAVEAEIAISVVDFGNAVSSTYRPTVIPQSNPNSFHGPNVSPAEAFDSVSTARRGRRGQGMTAYQADVFTRRRGNCKESFGPDNSKCLKNGAPITLPEGSFLENLHDSHQHTAP